MNEPPKTRTEFLIWCGERAAQCERTLATSADPRVRGRAEGELNIIRLYLQVQR